MAGIEDVHKPKRKEEKEKWLSPSSSDTSTQKHQKSFVFWELEGMD